MKYKTLRINGYSALSFLFLLALPCLLIGQISINSSRTSCAKVMNFDYTAFSPPVYNPVWKIQDTTIQAPTATYRFDNGGQHNVQLTLSMGCNTDTTITDTFSVPTNNIGLTYTYSDFDATGWRVDFDYSYDPCEGGPINFEIDESETSADSVKWDFDDGTTVRRSIKNGDYYDYHYSSNGTYNVSLTLYKYCDGSLIDDSTFTTTIDIKKETTLDVPSYFDWSIVPSDTACENATVDFNYDYFDTNADSARWVFGDGSSRGTSYLYGLDGIQHSYSSAGDKNIELQLFKLKCDGSVVADTTFYDTLTISNFNPEPLSLSSFADISIGPADPLCIDNYASFYFTGTTNADSFQWVSSDGDTSINRNWYNSFGSTGKKYIELTLFKVCNNVIGDTTLYDTLEVTSSPTIANNPEIYISRTPSDDTFKCIGEAIDMNSYNENTGDNDIDSIQWILDNANKDTIVDDNVNGFRYETAGTKYVQAQFIEKCGNAYSKLIVRDTIVIQDTSTISKNVCMEVPDQADVYEDFSFFVDADPSATSSIIWTLEGTSYTPYGNEGTHSYSSGGQYIITVYMDYYNTCPIARKDTIQIIDDGTSIKTPTTNTLEGVTVYPMPFSNQANFRYELAKDSKVQLSIYNLQGQKVKTVVQGEQSAGVHKERLDMSSANNGVYIYRLRTAEGLATGKIIVTK